MTSPLQATITGATRLLAIVGDPIHRVKSPGSFNPKLAAAGRDAVLLPLQIASADFESTIGGIMRIGNLDGLVVTMPFKDRIIPYLSSITPRAAQVGAVNAARRTGAGEWVGDMFDGVGLVGAVRSVGADPAGLSAGLLGAGGASSAIAFALAGSGVTSLRIADRDGARAARLAERVSDAYPASRVSAGDFAADEVDLIVNATPVGMADGDGTPIDVRALTGRTVVVDIVTKPSTALIAAAAAAGCRHAGGAAMVAAQTAALLAFLTTDDRHA